MKMRIPAVLAASVAAVVAIGSATAYAAGPPQADTAAVTAVVTPSEGGSISGFGITATFAPGAVSRDRLIVLGNWPNGLDVPTPTGETAVKTFGIQQCDLDRTNCTSPFGDYANSPTAGGTQRISGMELQYTGVQGVKFGSAANKLVTVTVDTTGNKVYIYNPNFSDTFDAYKLLPSSSVGSTLTFKTFRPIVWTVTSPTLAG
ncbi:MAG: hypothetical protein NVS9B1_17770 [Candidatus Dormibacteraceae bacterium]